MLSSALSLPLLALLSTVLASPINPPSRSFSIPISKRSGAFLREKRSVDEHVAMLEASVRSAYIKYGMRDGVVRRSGQVLLGDVTGDMCVLRNRFLSQADYESNLVRIDNTLARSRSALLPTNTKSFSTRAAPYVAFLRRPI
jgi:hypothetical protein